MTWLPLQLHCRLRQPGTRSIRTPESGATACREAPLLKPTRVCLTPAWRSLPLHNAQPTISLPK